MEVDNGNVSFDPVFITGIVGRCNLGTLKEVKDFFEMLEGFEIIYMKTTKGKKLWIHEEE